MLNCRASIMSVKLSVPRVGRRGGKGRERARGGDKNERKEENESEGVCVEDGGFNG